MRVFRLAFVLAMLFAGLTVATGCTKSKSNKNRFFTHGDPLKFLSGTTKNQKIDYSYFSDVTEIYLTDITAFQQAEESNKRSAGELKDEQKPSVEAVEAVRILTTVQYDKNKNQIRLINEDLDWDLLLFSDSSGNGKFLDSRDGEVSDIQHVSVSEDKNLISLAVSGGTGNNKYLVAMYFAKQLYRSSAPRTAYPYNYTAGTSQKVGWQKSNMRPFEICYVGAENAIINEITRNAISEWQQALGNLLSLNVNVAKNPKPFSDLNQSCLYIVDDYLTEENRGYANYGATLSIFDWNGSPRITDADIFLFTGEFAKAGRSMYHPSQREELVITIGHELGHLLGLDHEFSGIKSIMSYDFDAFSPTTHDKNAIRALYE